MAEELYERLLQIPTTQLVAMALAGLSHQGKMVAKVIERVRGQLDGVVGVARPERIYLAGCGDSYFAALSARYAFEQITGLATVAVESLELARYTLLPPGSLVIVISSGGEVSATLEAGRAARQAGVDAIGITLRKTSTMVQEFPCLTLAPDLSSNDAVDEYIHEAEQVALILGNFSFSLVALYLVAIHLGQRWGHPESRKCKIAVAEIEAVPEAIERAMRASSEIQEYLEGVSDRADFYFIGAGPSHGAALFYQAKFFEQARRPVYGVELEEFAHEQFLLLRPDGDAQVWFIAPHGPGRERVLEIMAGCREADAHVVAVTNSDEVRVQGQAHVTFAVEVASEMFSPLVSVVPGELLGIHALGRWGNVVSTNTRRRQMAQLTRGGRKNT